MGARRACRENRENSMRKPAITNTKQMPTLAKNKTLALLLSIPLGPFIWIYTYEKDKTKFWVGNAIQLFLVLAFIIAPLVFLGLLDPSQTTSLVIDDSFVTGYLLPLLIIFLAGMLLVRLWAFADRLAKTENWYAHYPRAPLSKTLAIVIAVLFGYLVWLYTYEADKKKLWTGLALIGSIWSFNMLSLFIGDSLLIDLLGSLLNVGFWIWAIIDMALKSDDWYLHYPTTDQPVSK